MIGIAGIFWGVVSFLLIVMFGLVKMIYDIISTRVKLVEDKSDKHNDRIKDLEAFNTHKIDTLIKDFKDFKLVVEAKLHKDANFILTANASINRIEPILRSHENMEDQIDELKEKIVKLEQKITA